MATASFDPLSFLMKVSPDLLTQYAKQKGIEFKTEAEETSEELAEEFMQILEKEFRKFVDRKYLEEYSLESKYKLVWGCEDCGGPDAYNDIKEFISTLLEIQRNILNKTQP